MMNIYLVMLILIIINISFITVIPITAQLNQTLEQTAGGNVTSTIKPQGTALLLQNESSMSDNASQTTTAGNVTSTINPQGTSMLKLNESSITDNASQTTTAGNVTSTIKPQGTSLDNPK
jgi:competence protein ComGC